MEKEIWKDISGYEGLYQVSNLGRVKRLAGISIKGKDIKERILTVSNHKGYLMITLYKDKKQKTYRIHRLVAEAFIPNPDNKPEVDHINTIRDDNRVENLRWVTKSENMSNPITKERSSEVRSGENSYWYGKHLPEETRQKISEQKSGEKHHMWGKHHTEDAKRRISETLKTKKIKQAKGVVCDGTFYPRMTLCAKFYNEKHQTMSTWLNGKRKMPQKYIDLGLRWATKEEIEEYYKNIK